jgi:DNA processing protein
MHEDTKYWVGFNHVKGIGPYRIEKLLGYFGNLQDAWKAQAHHLAAAGLNPKLCQQVNQIRAELCLEAVIDNLQEADVQILTWDDRVYPERLRQINQSPYVIYLKGDLIEQDLWSVAVVGTRRPSEYGRQVTETITSALAEQGLTIISGLARGIDGIAHQTALEGGGRTLAVLGCGLEHVYPPEHRDLAHRITLRGALISDYPPLTPPDGSNFPPRNRIISALSKAVLVMEAGRKSGAAITANYAAEQGK